MADLDGRLGSGPTLITATRALLEVRLARRRSIATLEAQHGLLARREARRRLDRQAAADGFIVHFTSCAAFLSCLGMGDAWLASRCVVEHVCRCRASLDILVYRRVCVRREETAVIVILIHRMLLLILWSVSAAVFAFATLLVEEREVVWVLAFLAAFGVTFIVAC